MFEHFFAFAVVVASAARDGNGRFGIVATAMSVSMILQTSVDDGKRGRVMSFFTIAFLGMMPLGSLATGALAGAIGAAAQHN